ncbi:DUF6624 domain-containing protein [Undibacterium terreum]|uniref:Uncharacterized protein n=1 Tax=Undibacterium terreum TaxID=1224302 RepID=A0A916U979_9BURK|nr:DUF6624 domain-containing protein [Undibacterium terreum]GGC65213.1 hypothetical protein GCM10011396_10270 [Undibacterium terreum]
MKHRLQISPHSLQLTTLLHPTHSAFFSYAYLRTMHKSILLFCIVLSISKLAWSQAKVDCDAEQVWHQFESMLENDKAIRFRFNGLLDKNRFSPGSISENEMDAAKRELAAIDQANQLNLDDIVTRCGWPNEKAHGALAVIAAFAIVQHGNREYRLKYFQNLKISYESGDLKAHSFATLLDRMLRDLGLPQKYGTQMDYQKSGIAVFGEVEDPEHLNARREQMGLSPIHEFSEKYPVSPSLQHTTDRLQ